MKGTVISFSNIFILSFLYTMTLLSGCGFSDKSNAAKALREHLPPQSIIFVGDTPESMTLNISSIPVSDQDLNTLRQEGYLSTIQKQWIATIASIGEKGKAYLTTEEGMLGKSWRLNAAIVSDVEITGMTEPSDMMGYKVMRVDFTAMYKLTPIGDLLSQKPKLTRNGGIMFVLYKDGWKVDRSTLNWK